MDQAFLEHLQKELAQLKELGLYKEERVIASPQQAQISLSDRSKVLNFCSNNYLGLANHPAVVEAASKSVQQFGFGLASVRFICGTQTIHIELEKKISEFLKTEATILYSSCFDANGGLFETLLGAEDAILTDSLNHASIIDGIRLCKAKRLRYLNNNMSDLEEKLKEAQMPAFASSLQMALFLWMGLSPIYKDAPGRAVPCPCDNRRLPMYWNFRERGAGNA